MKPESLIKENLKMKLGVVMAGGLTSESRLRAIEHIKMLDWVLSDSETTRDIRDIMPDY